jgi:phage gp36-like protein
MTYATEQDLIDRYGEEELIQLTDRANVGAIDSAVLARAIADADAEIEGYLVGRYALPLASVPPLLARLACDIARYHLYDDAPLEQVRTRYEDARAHLKGIANGTVQLGLPASAGAAPVSGSPEVDAPDRVFSRDTLERY